MFTGIVEETGTVESLKKNGVSFSMSIKADKIMDDIKVGDSIAVNGICLTATSVQRDGFTVDVMPETVLIWKERFGLIQDSAVISYRDTLTAQVR